MLFIIMNGVQGCTPFTFANGGNGMRMGNRLRKRRYAALGAAMWMLWGSSALCAAEGDNGSSSERVTTEAVNVEANYEKELLKEFAALSGDAVNPEQKSFTEKFKDLFT